MRPSLAQALVLSIACRGPELSAPSPALPTSPGPRCIAPAVPVAGASICLDEHALDEAMHRFGVSVELLEFDYADTAELRSQVEERNEQLRDSGFRFVLSGERVSIEADLPALTLRSVSTVRPLAQALAPVGLASDDRRAEITALARYVRGLLRSSPSLYRSDDSGTVRTTTGLTLPVETLAIGGGDCDSLTLLFGSLVRARSPLPLAYLGTTVQGEGHRLAAVGLPPRPGDQIIELEGQTLVVVDLTALPHPSPADAQFTAQLEAAQVTVEWVPAE